MTGALNNVVHGKRLILLYNFAREERFNKIEV